MREEWWELIAGRRPWVPPVIERLIVLELNPHPERPYRRPTWSDEEWMSYLEGWNAGQPRPSQPVML